MWLCTQIGFFSVVRKSADEYHIRSRVRRDLENLKGMMAVDLGAVLPDIEHWQAADYAWRIIVGGTAWGRIGLALVSSIDYSNFKSRIAALPDQREKLDGYHDLWHSGCEWQGRDPARLVSRLVNTSVDDMKTSVMHCTDLSTLQEALSQCEKLGHKTKAGHLLRRIKQLEKA